MFLRNYWYVATWARDLGRKPLARIMLNEPVVLFRKQDGTPVALEDRCIHRRLPLSMGRLIGDEIQCHYHGLVFDGTGTCVKIPGQERIPPSARVKSYPVVERNQCVFVWMGDAGAPDTSRLPTHFSVLDNEGWTTSLVYRPVQCNFQLINDNLLDLSHLATVHASTVGTAHVADLADVEAERDGNHVKVSRWTMDAPAATTYQQFGSYEGNIDRWQISGILPPSYSASTTAPRRPTPAPATARATNAGISGSATASPRKPNPRPTISGHLPTTPGPTMPATSPSSTARATTWSAKTSPCSTPSRPASTSIPRRRPSTFATTQGR